MRLVARARTLSWSKLAAGVAGGLTPERMLAVLGGLALGLTSLLSLGSLAYLVPVIAIAGVLLAARRAAGVTFIIGLCAGCLYGIGAAYLLARPLADVLAPTLKVIGLDAAALAVLTAVVLEAMRVGPVRRIVRKVFGAPPLRWLPGFAGFAVIVALAWRRRGRTSRSCGGCSARPRPASSPRCSRAPA